MTGIFGLYLVQKDKQILKGNPTRLLGLFSTEKLAKEARETVRSSGLYMVGKLKIFSLRLDEEDFPEGYVTVMIDEEDKGEGDS